MSLLLNHGINIASIIKRVAGEAETPEQMAQLLESEVWAYCTFMDRNNFYQVDMWEKAIPAGEVALVGEVYQTEEDFDDDYAGCIAIRNTVKPDGTLCTYYELVWKLQ